MVIARIAHIVSEKTTRGLFVLILSGGRNMREIKTMKAISCPVDPDLVQLIDECCYRCPWFVEETDNGVLCKYKEL